MTKDYIVPEHLSPDRFEKGYHIVPKDSANMIEQVKDKPYAFPVYAEKTKRFFVDANLILPTVKLVNNVAVLTAPLAIGAEFDLISLSMIESEILAGRMDETNILDKNIVLDKIYFQFGHDSISELILVKQQSHPDSRYVDPFEENRPEILEMTGYFESILSMNIDSYTVKLKFVIGGSIRADVGNCQVTSGKVQIGDIMDNDCKVIAPDDVRYQPLFDVVKNIKIIGYDLQYKLMDYFN